MASKRATGRGSKRRRGCSAPGPYDAGGGPLGALTRDAFACVVRLLGPADRGFLALCCRSSARRVRAYEYARGRPRAAAAAEAERAEKSDRAEWPRARDLVRSPGQSEWAADRGYPAWDDYMVAASAAGLEERLNWALRRSKRPVCAGCVEAAALSGSYRFFVRVCRSYTGSVDRYKIRLNACTSGNFSIIAHSQNNWPLGCIDDGSMEALCEHAPDEVILKMVHRRRFVRHGWACPRLWTYVAMHNRVSVARAAPVGVARAAPAGPPEGLPILSAAAQGGSWDMIDWLLDRGWSPSNPAEMRRAVERGWTRAMTYLLERGAEWRPSYALSAAISGTLAEVREWARARGL